MPFKKIERPTCHALLLTYDASNRPCVACHVDELIAGSTVVIDDPGQGGHCPAAVTAAVVHQHDGVVLRQPSPGPFADLVGEPRFAGALAGPVPGIHRPDGHRQARLAADLPRSSDDTAGWAEEARHLAGGLRDLPTGASDFPGQCRRFPAHR